MTNKKSLLLFIVLYALSSSAININYDNSEQEEHYSYIVTSLSPTDKKIIIGEKEYGVKDTIADIDEIVWTDDEQEIYAVRIPDAKPYIFSKIAFESKDAHTPFQFLHVRGSVRGVSDLPNIQTGIKDNYLFPEKRIALVVGNANYGYLNYLKNSLNDANRVSQKLLNLGFDVITQYDCNQTELKTAINYFFAESKNYDVMVFYYAGHGLQYNEIDYLLPCDIKLNNSDCLNIAISLNELVTQANNNHCDKCLFFIDACRDTAPSWTKGTNSILKKQIEAPLGISILYSTASGKVADDGTRGNSPFAKAFLTTIGTPGQPFVLTMDQIRREVLKNTLPPQNPIAQNNIMGEFYFKKGSLSDSIFSRPLEKQSNMEQFYLVNNESGNSKRNGSNNFTEKTDNAEELYKKGYEYYQKGDKQNYELAYNYFIEAANMGNLKAQCFLGLMYYFGHGIEQDYKEALTWFKKTENFAVSQFFLGYIYANGLEVEQNYNEAIVWYKKAAAQNIVEAQYNLGCIYYYGEGVNQDYTEASVWFKKAAKQNDDEAQLILGIMYYNGYGVKQNYKKAASLYKKAAMQNNAKAQNNLGLMYEEGHGVSQNYEKAIHWLTMATEQDFASAQYYLGTLYYDGKGVNQDYYKAETLYLMAAEKDHTIAQYNLGCMYRDLVIMQDYSKALFWFSAAAKQNDSEAQCNIGAIYYYGLGVDQDYIEALKWYSIASEQNDPTSQYMLGYMYQKGLGVEQNNEVALSWYKKAAQQNDPNAQAKLGYMYHNGIGTDKNIQEAAVWFEKAAKQDDAYSQYMLGLYYEKGLVFKKNLKISKSWYQKAADNGYDEAKKALKTM